MLNKSIKPFTMSTLPGTNVLHRKKQKTETNHTLKTGQKKTTQPKKQLQAMGANFAGWAAANAMQSRFNAAIARV